MTKVELKDQLQKIIAETNDENLLRDLRAVVNYRITNEEEDLSPELKSIIDERISDYEKNPDDSVSWEEVKNRLRSKRNSA